MSIDNNEYYLVNYSEDTMVDKLARYRNHSIFHQDIQRARAFGYDGFYDTDAIKFLKKMKEKQSQGNNPAKSDGVDQTDLEA